MTNPQIIPANFRVYRKCTHVWVLCAAVGEKAIPLASLRGVPGRKEVEYATFNTDHEVLKTIHRSIGLDWMQESVEHLRFLCGKE